jgi:2-hydroxy-3-keto-5-methylthiopentenyl-1-phosphate phosphatase
MQHNAGIHEFDFVSHFLHVHRSSPGQVAYFDFDSTIFDLDLIHWGLHRFAAKNPETGIPRWFEADQQYALGESDITIRDLLEMAYTEIFACCSKDELLREIRPDHKLVSGVKELFSWLRARNICPIGLTIGDADCAARLLEMHDICLPFIGNNLHFNDAGVEFRCVHEHTLDKGALVLEGVLAGYIPVCCFGDSGGDITMAEATAEAGGTVFARRGHRLASWCAQKMPDRSVEFDTMFDAIEHLEIHYRRP